MKRLRIVRAVVLGAAVSAGCDAGTDSGLDGGRSLPAAAAACAWNASPPELNPNGDEVRGILRGTSRNGSTTCTRQNGAGGPEALYLLRLPERALVELEVRSTLDTVLAVRRVCDDPLTELACNDSPLASPLAPPQAITPAGDRDAHLRAVLEAGTYYVVLDEAQPFGVGGAYVLRASAGPPPAQSSCPGARSIQDGTSLPSEALDLATELAPSCTGGEPRPALYYSATIPPGQRLTARALAVTGDRPWLPVLKLLGACGQGVCLATGRTSPDGQQRTVRHVNDGPTEQRVVLAVGGSDAVRGGTFRLDVGIGEALSNASCESARPIHDGLVLANQDLSEGRAPTVSPCRGGASQSLFYSATVAAGQFMSARARGTDGATGLFHLAVRDGCSALDCLTSGAGQINYVNAGPGPRTVIVEVAAFDSVPSARFELQVFMPLPPEPITVTPIRGLQTSEAGGQATFAIALAAAPLETVVIPLVSSDPSEGTVSPAKVQFDPATWQTPRTVTVTGADDARKDGARPYQVRVGPATSADERYAGVPASTVSLLNRDDEAGIQIEAPSALHTTESGGQATFTVGLDRAPTATVRLPLGTSDAGEGTVSPTELVFEPAGWDQPRTVTVTGVDDAESDGPEAYRILLGPVTSADPEYAGLDAGDLDARNRDDDLMRVPAQLVSGTLSCQAAGPLVPRAAVDLSGNLYVAMPCQAPGDPAAPVGSPPTPGGARAPTPPPIGRLFVATSRDDGRTFAPPVDTGQVAYEAQIAGAGPGVAVLAIAGPSGLVILRSEDAGATWQPPTVLAGGSGEVRLAAAGDEVIVGAGGYGGPFLWTSQDAGQSFQRISAAGQRQLHGVAIDEATGALWIASRETDLVLRQSRDGGATFDPEIVVGDHRSHAFAIGPRAIFVAGEQPQLSIVERDLSSRRAVGGLLATLSFPRALVADAANNVVVLESQDGHLQARRLPSGGESFLPARSLGIAEAAPAGAALSASALAVALFSGGQVRVAVETWP